MHIYYLFCILNAIGEMMSRKLSYEELESRVEKLVSEVEELKRMVQDVYEDIITEGEEYIPYMDDVIVVYGDDKGDIN